MEKPIKTWKSLSDKNKNTNLLVFPLETVPFIGEKKKRKKVYFWGFRFGLSLSAERRRNPGGKDRAA